MQGASTALNSSIMGRMRSWLKAMSSLTSVPENQPPHRVTSAALRMGSMMSGSRGKRRPISMPVKPAERDWRRHSSSDTSSLSSTRSSFHHAMGDMPSLAFTSSLQFHKFRGSGFGFIGLEHPSSDLPLGKLVVGHLLLQGEKGELASRVSSNRHGWRFGETKTAALPLLPLWEKVADPQPRAKRAVEGEVG